MGLIDRLLKKPGDQEIVTAIDSMFDTDKDISRRILERIWWRNILYYAGEQWIEWVKGTSTFRRRLIFGNTSTPVSNEIRDFVRAVKSMLLNQKMVPRVVANTEERQDVDAADLAGNLLTYMDSLDDFAIEDEKEKCVIGVSVFGTAFLRTIPFKEGGKWFIQKDGSVITTGDVVTENVMPFNVVMDSVGDTLRKKRCVGVQSLRNKQWVEDTFKTKVSSDSIQSVDYQRKLATLVGQVSPWKGAGLDYITSSAPDDDLVTLKEVEFRPTPEYPNGRYFITCGGKLMQKNDRMPIKVEKGSWMYSLVDFHWNFMPGRFWSDSGVDDLISPQNTINEIDKALSENRKSLGRTTVVTPGEIAMKRMSDRDDQVLVLSYDAIAAAGGKPVFQQGIALPEQVIEERNIHKMQMQELGGDPKNVLKGQAPSAHASGVMTDVLRETAERGHYPDMERYNRSMSRVYKNRLLVAKEMYTEERMIKVKGKGNRMKAVAFKASDLRDNTDVRMEIDSGLASTKAGQRETLMGLLKMGIFATDIQTDPTIRQEVLRRFGFSGFADINNVDIERADRENSMFAAKKFEGIMLVKPPVQPDSPVLSHDGLFKFDNHQIHFEIHRRFILCPEFADLPVEVQNAAIIHNDVHHLQVQAAQAAAQKAQMDMQSAGKGGGKPGEPQGAPNINGGTPPEGGGEGQ